MTANDNIRHYIGDLEATEDIDIVFKHIYDLMLANGGENSGLNADMVDGYHASDFAPASLKDELDKCIHSITWGGEKYTGRDIVLEILASKILFFENESPNPIDIETYLNSIKNQLVEAQDHITDMQMTMSFLDSEETQDALTHIIQNNISNVTGEGGETRTYFNADSVNGLSFQVLTQDEYDLLPKEQKEDFRNIYIINNDIEAGSSESEYVPPSILQAGMNLEFRINTATNNVEFSVDGKKADDASKVWKILMPLVGTVPNANDENPDSKKGLLYPQWFALIKNLIDGHLDLQDQDNYPFLLNTPESKSNLATELSGDKVDGITIGGNTLRPTENSNTINLSDTLDNYINTWISTHASTIQDTIDLTNKINTAIANTNPEILSNKLASTATGGLSGNSNDTKYPTTKAVKDYVDSVKTSLQSSINAVAPDSGWQGMSVESSFSDATSTKTAGKVWFRKIGKIVYVSGSIMTKKSLSFAKMNTYIKICSIPSGFRPKVACRMIGQGTYTDRVFVWADSASDNLYVGRVDYQNKRQSGGYTLPAEFWIAFSGTWMVA